MKRVLTAFLVLVMSIAFCALTTGCSEKDAFDGDGKYALTCQELFDRFEGVMTDNLPEIALVKGGTTMGGKEIKDESVRKSL